MKTEWESVEKDAVNARPVLDTPFKAFAFDGRARKRPREIAPSRVKQEEETSPPLRKRKSHPSRNRPQLESWLTLKAYLRDALAFERSQKRAPITQLSSELTGDPLPSRLRSHQLARTCTDERFSPGLCPVDEIPGVDIALVVNLGKKGFSFNSQVTVHPYDQNNMELLQALDDRRIPNDLMDELQNAQCSDGRLVIEVRDFRLTTDAKPDPQVRRILLEPDGESVVHFIDQVNIEDYHQSLSADERLAIEEGILQATGGPLCLDPSTSVVRVANILQYNRLKFGLRPRSNRIEADPDEAKTGHSRQVSFHKLPTRTRQLLEFLHQQSLQPSVAPEHHPDWETLIPKPKFQDPVSGTSTTTSASGTFVPGPKPPPTSRITPVKQRMYPLGIASPVPSTSIPYRYIRFTRGTQANDLVVSATPAGTFAVNLVWYDGMRRHTHQSSFEVGKYSAMSAFVEEYIRFRTKIENYKLESDSQDPGKKTGAMNSDRPVQPGPITTSVAAAVAAAHPTIPAQSSGTGNHKGHASGNVVVKGKSGGRSQTSKSTVRKPASKASNSRSTASTAKGRGNSSANNSNTPAMGANYAARLAAASISGKDGGGTNYRGNAAQNARNIAPTAAAAASANLARTQSGGGMARPQGNVSRGGNAGRTTAAQNSANAIAARAAAAAAAAAQAAAAAAKMNPKGTAANARSASASAGRGSTAANVKKVNTPAPPRIGANRGGLNATATGALAVPRGSATQGPPQIALSGGKMVGKGRSGTTGTVPSTAGRGGSAGIRGNTSVTAGRASMGNTGNRGGATAGAGRASTGNMANRTASSATAGRASIGNTVNKAGTVTAGRSSMGNTVNKGATPQTGRPSVGGAMNRSSAGQAGAASAAANLASAKAAAAARAASPNLAASKQASTTGNKGGANSGTGGK